MERYINNTKSFTTENFNDNKISKALELNPTMSIDNRESDEYTQANNNIGSRGVR